jgi:putative Mn2+ efflux pump MntP
MLFDIRLPIGLIFTIFGAIVSMYGLLSDRALYDQHSFGFNINLWWGLLMFIFGVSMLIYAFRKRKTA